MYFFPFFLECMKMYHKEPQKQKILQQLAFGKGGFVIIKNNVLLTPAGEFKIPEKYSLEAQQELDTKLWKKDEYSVMLDDIKNTMTSWSTINKKNKTYLLYKYCAAHFENEERVRNCCYLNVAHIMKLIKPSDVVYKVFEIVSIDPSLVNPLTYEKIVNVCKPHTRDISDDDIE